MKLKSKTLGLPVSLLGALAAFATGCAGGAGTEDVGAAQEGLSFTPWTEVPTSSPFEAVGQYGPTFVSQWDTHFWALTVAYDNNVYQMTYNSVPGTWSNWAGVAPTQAWSKPGAVSWYGPSGSSGQNNVAMAYVGSDSQLHIGAWMNVAGGYTWSAMSDASFASSQPALAYSNGSLYLFVKKSDNLVYYKKNVVGANSYNPSSWSASWTALGTVAVAMSGIGAAAVSGSIITVAGTAMDGSTNCRYVNFNTSTGTVGAWTWLPTTTCAWAQFSTPAMTALDRGGSSGAQVVAFGTDNNLYTASTTGGSSWAWSEVPPGSCTTGANPGITAYNGTSNLAIGTTCAPSENLSWRKMTP